MYSSNIKKMNIVVGFLLFVLTIIGYFFAESSISASLLWPAFGVSAMYYYYYDKKILLGIIIGILMGQLFNEIMFETDTGLIDIFMRISYVIISVLEMITFKIIADYLISKSKNIIYNLCSFLLAGILTTFIGGLFVSSLFYLFIDGDYDFITLAIRWMLGDLSGLLIFASIIYFSLLNKERFVFSLRVLLFNMLYLLFSLLIFSSSLPSLNYDDYNYFFVLFFVASAFIFNYSNIFTLALEFLLFYQFLYIRFTLSSHDIDSISEQLLDLNIFLGILIIVTLIIKTFYDNHQKDINIINEKNTRLEGILNAVNSFFSIGDQLFFEHENLNDKYLRKMFHIATTIFDKYDGASCYTKTKDEICFIETIGYDVESLNKIGIDVDTFKLDTKRAMYLIDKPTTNVGNLRADEFMFRISKIRESICIGIEMDDGITGGITLDLHNGSEIHFEESDKESLQSFQTHMNSFYKKSKTISETQTLKNDLVFSLVRTLELYDKYTSGHSEQVAELSQELGRRLKISEKNIIDLFWAGICHDIGKIGVRHGVINKESKLTKAEYEEVKLHSIYAYDILVKNKDLENIAKMVRHHHERWDGLGYPDGLSKNEIPYESQILMVADSVSSMITNRPYNVVKSEEQVIEELKRCSGTQFNPKISECMIQLIEEGILKKDIHTKINT